MDWFTIVLIVIFFVLPLVQQAIEQARRSKQPPLPSEDGDQIEYREVPEPASTSIPAPPRQQAESDTSWSEGWAPWPAEVTGDPEPAEEPPTWEQPKPWSPEAPPERRPLPAEAAPSSPPPIEVEEARYIRRAPAAPLDPREAAARTTRPRVEVPRRLATGDVRHGQRGVSSVFGQLSGATELRKAIILREILGPPVSMRQPGDDLPR